MESIQESIREYKQQMERGMIQKAYRLIMDYVLRLKSHFQKNYPEYAVGNVYSGYMDMTYFPLFPKNLAQLKLKVAVVFIHDTCHFEAWLSGMNRQVQKEYVEIVKKNSWDKYRVNPQNPDFIIEKTIETNPDFSDPARLTKNIELSVVSFIKDIESFFSKRV